MLTKQSANHPTYKNIPQPLRDRPQWVAWESVPVPGHPKPKKVPYDPNTGAPAEPNNPATWGTFEDALTLCESKGLDGIDYVFSIDDPYTGIDLDHCRDALTGEIVPWAQTVIAVMGSYTELSPSLTGVHILVQAKLPPGGRKKPRVEMYDSGRYFTVTGNHLDGTPLTIEPRQAQVESLHRRVFDQSGASSRTKKPTRGRRTAPRPQPSMRDETLLRRALKARNGSKLARLWRGDTRGYGSPSEADMALCGILAFWTQDAEQLDRLFRRSGLYRAKWEDRHYANGQSYGDKIIEKVLAKRQDQEEAYHV
jgi:primase-polymerase (primpol)-like protein